MRRRGAVRACEHVRFERAPAPDPSVGITWIGPFAGGTKHGTARNDTLLGSHGPDRLDGAGGNDVLWGNHLHNDPSSAADILRGGPGNDTVYGGSGTNQIWGGDGNDYLQGGAGRNTISGGRGSDTIRLRGRGRNSVDAGASNDTIQAYSRGVAVIRCGAGNDTVEIDRNDRPARDCERRIRH